MRARKGVTLAELMIVTSIVGVVAGVALPRLATIRERADLSAATTRFTRGVVAARQAAIFRGAPAAFKTNGSTFWVVLDTTGSSTDSVVITPPIDIARTYGVQVSTSASETVIPFDPRGISTQAAERLFTFRHLASNAQTTICVSRLGNTIRERCP